MKKYISYSLILGVGLLLGWLLFGGTSTTTPSKDMHNHDSAMGNQMWTCSMHPQIMQPEPGDCPICGMDLIPAASGSEGLAPDQFKMTKNAMALANVQTTSIGNSTTEDNTITVSGTIVANEATNVAQASYFQGRIERLYINATGESIKKGQLLASIYSPELIKAQQELLTTLAIKESQPSLYNAVRNKLKLWKLSEAQIQQIETAKKVIENFPVYATVSGTVSDKMVNQGDYIKQGQTLLKVSNLYTVWANFDVYENQLTSFKKGQAISITTRTYPSEVFMEKIDFIEPVLNPKTRTVHMRVVLNNKSGKFKPGMFVNGKVSAENANGKNLLQVPASAVLWTGKRSVIYVKVKPNEPIFEMRTVILGNKVGDVYEVKSGLKPGEEVVTNGTFTVDASAQLAGKKSMMNHDQSIPEIFEVPKMFQTQLQKVYDQYIQLKDAFIQSDINTAQQAAKQLEKALTKVDMKLLSDANAHKQWMLLAKTIQSKTNAIQLSTDIKIQRKAFKPLSDHLIMAVSSFGIMEKTYKQFCPMANSDKGAYWLSKDSLVLNPYFGDQMLKCGEVKEAIEKQ